VLTCLGYLDQAISRRDAAIQEARQLSHPPTLAIGLGAIGWWTGSLLGLEPVSLLQCADEYLALATEHGLGFDRMVALMSRGSCLATLGRADEGIPLFTAGMTGWDDLGFLAHRPRQLTLLGDAYRMAGQLRAALEHLTGAGRLAEDTENRYALAETLRLRGSALEAMDDAPAAEANYREAIAIAQQQNAKLWELRAAMSLAKLWRDQGKRAEAHALLAPVYGWFTGGFGTPVLQEAKALLGQLA
jgi:predicted ATPase